MGNRAGQRQGGKGAVFEIIGAQETAVSLAVKEQQPVAARVIGVAGIHQSAFQAQGGQGHRLALLFSGAQLQRRDDDLPLVGVAVQIQMGGGYAVIGERVENIRLRHFIGLYLTAVLQKDRPMGALLWGGIKKEHRANGVFVLEQQLAAAFAIAQLQKGLAGVFRIETAIAQFLPLLPGQPPFSQRIEDGPVYRGTRGLVIKEAGGEGERFPGGEEGAVGKTGKRQDCGHKTAHRQKEQNISRSFFHAASFSNRQRAFKSPLFWPVFAF